MISSWFLRMLWREKPCPTCICGVFPTISYNNCCHMTGRQRKGFIELGQVVDLNSWYRDNLPQVNLDQHFQLIKTTIVTAKLQTFIEKVWDTSKSLCWVRQENIRFQVPWTQKRVLFNDVSLPNQVDRCDVTEFKMENNREIDYHSPHLFIN